MALIFPNPANLGDQYVADNGITYVYDGVKWIGNTPANNPFNQSLNTTDDVTFNSVSTPVVQGTDGVTITAGFDPSSDWKFRSDGDLLAPRNVVSQGGHFYQDAADNGNTSIRWINIDTSGGQDIEMARVYAQGGNPVDGYNDLDSNERLQFGQRELGDNVSSFYISLTRNEFGLNTNPGDDVRWNFTGNGDLNLPGPGQITTPDVEGSYLSWSISDIQLEDPYTNPYVVISGPTWEFILAQVTISGVEGAVEANGTWYAEYSGRGGTSVRLYVDANKSQPVDASAWGAYTGGGIMEFKPATYDLNIKAGLSYPGAENGNVNIYTNDGIEHQWSFGNDGSLMTPTGVGIHTIEPGFAQIGINDYENTTLIVGNQYQGLAVQTDGTVVVQSRVDSEAATVILGSPAFAANTNGGDVLILGGFSGIGGVNGYVQIGGHGVQVDSINGVSVTSQDGDYEWFFDTDGGLVFPDLTTQYTAWQGAAVVSDTAPDNDLGRLWFNSTDGRTYVKYNDNWVDANPQVIPSPETYLDGLTIDGTTIGVVDAEAEQTVNIADNIRILGGKIYINGHEISVTAQGKITVDGGETVAVLDGGSASTWLTPV